MPETTWPTYPRWMLEDHEIELRFRAQLSTGRAAEVSTHLQQNPADMQVIMQLLGDKHTPLSVSIGIGVVMEDFADSELLRQYIPDLAQHSQHRLARIRADACHYLGLSADPQAIPPLQACLQDRDPSVQEVASDALAELQAS